MLYLLKQAVHLNGVNYAPGTHDLPESAVNSHYFPHLLKSGWAVPADKLAPKQESAQVIQHKLAETLAAREKARMEKAKATAEAGSALAPEAPSSHDEDLLVESGDSDSSPENTRQEKNKKHAKR